MLLYYYPKEREISASRGSSNVTQCEKTERRKSAFHRFKIPFQENKTPVERAYFYLY
jgi:hypothetical protein